MSQAILVLNAGSSSIKFALFAASNWPVRQAVLCEGQCEGFGHRVHFHAGDEQGNGLVDTYLQDGSSHEDALSALLLWIGSHFAGHALVAAGHRVVHGGPTYNSPVLIDDAVIKALRACIPLAPLHQPHHLAAIDALSALYPHLVQVACFDTAFHHDEPYVATQFALPQKLTDEGVRRYGFHGLSYEYIASVLPDVLGPQQADGRVIVAHLGSGASLCAMRARKSVATTMGFTALDGLPMSRRCGALDPGVVLYLMQEKGMTAQAVSDLLYHDSGLWGVSGISDDMQTLLASDAPSAARAVDLFVYRIGREIGSLAAALGGLDALVFTAGIGEHSQVIRKRVCQNAAWLGVALDCQANVAARPRISGPDSAASAWVIPTDEDLMVARHTFDVVHNHAGAAGCS